MIQMSSVDLNRKGKKIFSDLNLTVMKNEKVLIQGKSGIGKTTLFKVLLGFETIDKGSVTINGNRIDKDHIQDIREQLFYLSQDIDLKNDTVGALLEEIFIQNHKKPLESTRLNQLMGVFELNVTLLEQQVKELSGGERQRIGLVICFLLDRPVWLLDEPTASLDDIMKKKIADLILGQEKTMIIVSHDDVWKNNPAVKIERWI
ncbi:ATP-binding cassette domain-containing protein [Desulfobacula sp.]|uniref:ABC transporter ATP-binding protein n=1 Tax=Desulfobacula sp. TaxID=2593537 RepID=UPI00263A2D41|nr:ATP-binding cassette domain-containing protein [Desulfobacula sp.]